MGTTAKTIQSRTPKLIFASRAKEWQASANERKIKKRPSFSKATALKAASTLRIQMVRNHEETISHVCLDPSPEIDRHILRTIPVERKLVDLDKALAASQSVQRCHLIQQQSQVVASGNPDSLLPFFAPPRTWLPRPCLALLFLSFFLRLNSLFFLSCRTRTGNSCANISKRLFLSSVKKKKRKATFYVTP